VARLSSDSEITAMRACGVGLRDIVLPIFAMGVVVSCFTWYIALEVEHRAKRVLRDVVVSVTASGQMIESGRFKQLGDRMIYVDHRARDNRLEGVFIADHSDPSRLLLIFAESGRLSVDAETQQVRVLLDHGDLHSEAEDGSEGSDYRMSFESFEYVFTVEMPRELDFRILRPRDMSMEELRRVVARVRAGKPIRHLWITEVEKYEVQIHRRYALPVAPMIFGLLAVPISLGRARGARAWGALLCALLVGAYYGGLSFTQYLAAKGVLPAGLALWIPNVVFGGLAIVLLWRAGRLPA
jgi:lipopolysaccharide export system permease protein